MPRILAFPLAAATPPLMPLLGLLFTPVFHRLVRRAMQQRAATRLLEA